MSVAIPSRQDLAHVIDKLPTDVLPELGAFLDYLQFKVSHTIDLPDKLKVTPQANGASFLLAIAGLGASGAQDLSERAEEILANEIDPIRGWGLSRESKP